MKLLLVRHGNCEKEEQDPALSKTGIKQARLLAKRLSELPITKVYVSDLKRAFQTFKEYKKLKTEVPAETAKEIREIYRVLVGGEPKEGTSQEREIEDKKRIESFIKKISSKDNDEVMLLFTHANVIEYIISWFLESEPKKIGPHLHIATASVSLVEIDEKGADVMFVNSIEHLMHGQPAYFPPKEKTDYIDA